MNYNNKYNNNNDNNSNNLYSILIKKTYVHCCS